MPVHRQALIRHLLLTRHSTIILFFLFSNSFCFSQTKEDNFKSAVVQVVSGFAKQDSVKLAKYINKEIGVYQLDRVGVFDHYNHFKSVTFSEVTYPQVLINQSKNIKLLLLKYAALPIFSCDKGTWSKKGLFVDTTKTDHLLSKIC